MRYMTGNMLTFRKSYFCLDQTSYFAWSVVNTGPQEYTTMLPMYTYWRTKHAYSRFGFSVHLGKIKKNYAERVGVAAGSVRLIFDGSPVSDTDTPRGLSLEDDDVIEAFVEQTGGSSSYSTASACSSTNRCFNRIPQSRARRWSTRILESSFEQRSAPICSNAHNLDQRRRIWSVEWHYSFLSICPHPLA